MAGTKECFKITMTMYLARKQNQNLFNAFYPTIFTVLNMCLYVTYSKMGQLQKQWIHILQVSKINFKYKGYYQGRNSPKVTDFSQRSMSTAYKEKAIDQRTQIVPLISLHSKYIHKKRVDKGKIKVHSCSRLKRKTLNIPPYKFRALSIPRPCHACFFFFFFNTLALDFSIHQNTGNKQGISKSQNVRLDWFLSWSNSTV